MRDGELGDDRPVGDDALRLGLLGASRRLGPHEEWLAWRAAAREAVDLIKDAVRGGLLVLPKRESEWLNRIESELGSLPESEEDLMGPMIESYGTLFSPASYGL